MSPEPSRAGIIGPTEGLVEDEYKPPFTVLFGLGRGLYCAYALREDIVVFCYVILENGFAVGDLGHMGGWNILILMLFCVADFLFWLVIVELYKL